MKSFDKFSFNFLFYPIKIAKISTHRVSLKGPSPREPS